ncbi:MAG: hypothetical protein JXA94_02500 [Parachlamydiales bacterium]|nr:hypothetical protein [Parachlamydiales bacterium]
MSTYKEQTLNKKKLFSQEELLKIQPEFFMPPNYDFSHLESYFSSIQNLINETIPKSFFDNKNDAKKFFLNLNKSLPLFHFSDFKNPPFLFTFSFLCFADFTHGVGRFTSDMISKWLTIGKPIPINGQRSLEFKFKLFPKRGYFIAQYFINIQTTKDLNLIKKNITSFTEELKLIILSVQHARHINSISKLSDEQKSLLIQENIFSLLDKSSKKVSAFEQMEDFIFKISEEKKLTDIKNNLAYLMQQKPNIYDRAIFDSLHNVSMLFKSSFTGSRSTKHVSRIIALLYLFKKSILNSLTNSNVKKRVVNLKLLTTNHQTLKKKVLGILIVMNLLHENEYFEKRFILESISHLIKDFKYVEDSYIVDHRDDKLLSFYLEIEKTKEDEDFTTNEIYQLKSKLPDEFKGRMKKVLNPIFLPRNEEEILRNIIVLSKQLRYVKDIPQVIITYEKQTEKEVSFNVILLRLIKEGSISIKNLFSYSKSFLTFSLDESKIVGILKKKYPKEANIFKISLNKFLFLRRDYSLDLRKARLAVASELMQVLGEFRDFNGGMLNKQTEALEQIKKIMVNLKKSEEFLLENFFYSIRPGIMQSILESLVLKKFFSMFLNIIKQNVSQKKCLYETQMEEGYFFIMIATNNKAVIDDIIMSVNKLKIKSFELISSSLDYHEVKTLGYILRENDNEKIKIFKNAVICKNFTNI